MAMLNLSIILLELSVWQGAFVSQRIHRRLFADGQKFFEYFYLGFGGNQNTKET